MVSATFTLGTVLARVVAETCAALAHVPDMHVQLMDDMLTITERLNEVAAYAEQPHVSRFLDSLDLDHPASRKLAALSSLQTVLGTKGTVWMSIVDTPKTGAQIALETGIPYQTVFNNLNQLMREDRADKVGKAPASGRGGTATLFLATGWDDPVPSTDDTDTDLDDDIQGDENDND